VPRKPFTVRIDETLINRFKDYVMGKYGKLHGALGPEVHEALNHWLNEQGLAAHTNTRINPGIPRVQMTCEKIMRRLRDDRGCFNQCHMNDLRWVITYERGSDPRTIKKWIQTLERLGRIKFYAHNVWEII